MIATRDTALVSAIDNLGGIVARNLKRPAECVGSSHEAEMLSLAVTGLIEAALLLAFKSASAQSTGSFDSAAPLGKKRPSR